MAYPISPSGQLDLTDLCFAYGKHEVLRDLTATFPPGVSGLLGVNGAGKTTALRVAAGIARPKAGAVSFDGRPVTSHADRSWLRSQVGYLPQNPRWYPESTVGEFVTYIAASQLGRKGKDHVGPTVDRALEAADVAGLRDKQLGQLSGGQQRRAFLAQAIVHDPPILILDEPTAGLDPLQRIRLREKVIALSDTRVVVWATHIIDDLMSMADRIVIIDEGVRRWSGTPEELVARGAASQAETVAEGISAGERGFLQVISNGNTP